MLEQSGWEMFRAGLSAAGSGFGELSGLKSLFIGWCRAVTGVLVNRPSLTGAKYYSKYCSVQVGPSYSQERVAARLALGLSPPSRSPGLKRLWARQSPRCSILQ